ncbi:uncharacterized protein MAM_05063 [Metarhizium album ARSEF 1941]|uniref:Uncharacterized protein n=1 Tax=Metarhizium album (strain ARSEF 1941) TaxID=1081103 RepID=A0A0B2WTG2_METAS|nr:uncharacterized protein MAM_05063 [Metarhizium album ARSEF 1941]KHN96954.1 hypothetical protein MAM_05063 [Metarhizium album ARSEF 1941]
MKFPLTAVGVITVLGSGNIAGAAPQNLLAGEDITRQDDSWFQEHAIKSAEYKKDPNFIYNSCYKTDSTTKHGNFPCADNMRNEFTIQETLGKETDFLKEQRMFCTQKVILDKLSCGGCKERNGLEPKGHDEENKSEVKFLVTKFCNNTEPKGDKEYYIELYRKSKENTSGVGVFNKPPEFNKPPAGGKSIDPQYYVDNAKKYLEREGLNSIISQFEPGKHVTNATNGNSAHADGQDGQSHGRNVTDTIHVPAMTLVKVPSGTQDGATPVGENVQAADISNEAGDKVADSTVGQNLTTPGQVSTGMGDVLRIDGELYIAYSVVIIFKLNGYSDGRGELRIDPRDIEVNKDAGAKQIKSIEEYEEKKDYVDPSKLGNCKKVVAEAMGNENVTIVPRKEAPVLEPVSSNDVDTNEPVSKPVPNQDVDTNEPVPSQEVDTKPFSKPVPNQEVDTNEPVSEPVPSQEVDTRPFSKPVGSHKSSCGPKVGAGSQGSTPDGANKGATTVDERPKPMTEDLGSIYSDDKDNANTGSGASHDGTTPIEEGAENTHPSGVSNGQGDADEHVAPDDSTIPVTQEDAENKHPDSIYSNTEDNASTGSGATHGAAPVEKVKPVDSMAPPQAICPPCDCRK